ncbi:MAG: hypothetical protein RML14_11735 [Meiothermus sp.]|uniref:hypothetical protein n=1 Tax=Meiothermus sp. TaxID=1955249 RepID=UPI00298EE00B|nr:hypothetical protein [Meiothermus sp.]MDW8482508.1 hypothetical protein [Meiothermus sp.]
MLGEDQITLFLVIIAVFLVSMYALGAYVTRSAIYGLSYKFGLTLVFEISAVIAFLHVYDLPFQVSFTSMIVISLLYVIYFGLLLAGYLLQHDSKRTSAAVSENLNFSYSRPVVEPFAWGLIGLATILILFISQLVDAPPFSRMFYERTRVGFGHLYYPAVLFTNLAVVLGLFAVHGKLQKPILVLSGIVLSAAFGSKWVLALQSVVVVYYAYAVLGYRIDTRKVVPVTLGIGASLIFAFWLFSPFARSNLLDFSIQYSEYTRNLMLVVETWNEYKYGQLTLENNLFPLLPRALYPEKPLVFGSLRLSEHYYPESVELSQGLPSFGPFGAVWADFGPLAFLIVGVVGFAQGFLIRKIEIRLYKRNHIGLFIAYITLVGLPLINPGVISTTVIAINIAIGIMLHWVCLFRLRPGGNYAYSRR